MSAWTVKFRGTQIATGLKWHSFTIRNTIIPETASIDPYVGVGGRGGESKWKSSLESSESEQRKSGDGTSAGIGGPRSYSPHPAQQGCSGTQLRSAVTDLTDFSSWHLFRVGRSCRRDGGALLGQNPPFCYLDWQGHCSISGHLFSSLHSWPIIPCRSINSFFGFVRVSNRVTIVIRLSSGNSLYFEPNALFLPNRFPLVVQVRALYGNTEEICAPFHQAALR